MIFCGPGIGAGPGFVRVLRAGFRVANFKFRVPGRAWFWLRVPGTRTKTRNFFGFFLFESKKWLTSGEVGDADKIFLEWNHLEIKIQFELESLKDRLMNKGNQALPTWFFLAKHYTDVKQRIFLAEASKNVHVLPNSASFQQRSNSDHRWFW